MFAKIWKYLSIPLPIALIHINSNSLLCLYLAMQTYELSFSISSVLSGRLLLKYPGQRSRFRVKIRFKIKCRYHVILSLDHCPGYRNQSTFSCLTSYLSLSFCTWYLMDFSQHYWCKLLTDQLQLCSSPYLHSFSDFPTLNDQN